MHKRRFERLLNEVVAAHPDTEFHVVLDNLSTHKPKHDRWLARHRNVHIHFTPTHASWLNQVEVWFSILKRSARRRKPRRDPASGAIDHRPPSDDVLQRRLNDGRTFQVRKIYCSPIELEPALARAGFADARVETSERFFLLGQAHRP